jgi:hypothetical protein
VLETKIGDDVDGAALIWLGVVDQGQVYSSQDIYMKAYCSQGSVSTLTEPNKFFFPKMEFVFKF